MSVTVGEVCRAIDGFAPFECAEAWDNVGILAGSADQEARGILCALELNFAVIDEAVRLGANLIVTHHPILFRGKKNLREDDPEGRMLCRLVRERIALIAAHTNFDNAETGVNDALAAKLGLQNVERLESGMRIGSVEETTLGAFCARAEAALGGPVRRYGEVRRSVRRIAVLGGAGGDYAHLARAAGADVYLTGEISHHRAWDAYLSGMCALEAGHAATELPAIHLLADGLQKAADGVKWNVHVYESEVELFR